MTTKIEGMPPGMPRPSSSAGSTPRAAESARGSQAASTAAAGDSVVRVSGEAASLASLERAMAESPAFDAAKVAEVRAAIESGSYQADARQIAARMGAMERALGA
jgi:negative regulator of flagellin synthesis FlgM